LCAVGLLTTLLPTLPDLHRAYPDPKEATAAHLECILRRAGACPQEPTNPEAIAQNVLAVALAAVLTLAAGNVLWKILVVCWALISAAARYSVVAMVLLVIAVFLS